MSDMKVIPFKYEHLEVMDIRDYEKENVVPRINSAWINAVEREMFNYTVMKEGKIVTCLGSICLWEGVYELWQIPSIYVKDYVKEYCVTVRGLIDNSAKTAGARRIQTHSPADELHDRWMKFIGFECEGTLKEYTVSREDYRIWARRY